MRTKSDYFSDVILLVTRLRNTTDNTMPLGWELRMIIERIREETMDVIAQLAMDPEEDETIARARKIEVDS